MDCILFFFLFVNSVWYTLLNLDHDNCIDFEYSQSNMLLDFYPAHPQGTFLVGQPAQGSGKQGGSSSAGHAASSPATVSQQAIRVTAGQKAAILAQVSICNKT